MESKRFNSNRAIQAAPVNPRSPVHLPALHALMQAAYSVEAARLGLDGSDFPPLRESQTALRASGETFWGAWEGETLVAVLAFTAEHGEFVVTRMAVAPERFRQGLASFLLADFTQRHDQVDLAVATAAENLPAIHLYQKHGFNLQGSWSSKEGIMLVKLVRPSPGGTAPPCPATALPFRALGKEPEQP